jgi:SPP1 gp7 family putative phage head morphogenesis protein
MNKKEWKYRTRTEKHYVTQLLKASRFVARSIEGLETIDAIVTRLKDISEQKAFSDFARIAAFNMVKSVSVENAKTWREAAKQLGRPQQIHKLLREEFRSHPRFLGIVRQNADLITSIPKTMAKDVTAKASTLAIGGIRSDDLVAEIKKQVPGLAEYKARMIARTEVAKTNAAITEIRATEIGRHLYIWRTVQDQRVRSSHAFMEGVVCSFNAPPCPELLDPRTPESARKRTSEYNPGGIYNCRCYAETIIIIDQLTFPVKVAIGNRIVRMNKKQFMEYMG